MRIISQNGVYDLPYDKCIVQIDGREINASPIGEPDSYYQMASYSTQEKAEDVMDNLHAALILHEEYKRADVRTQAAIVTAWNDKQVIVNRRGIFKFPKEEEIK